VGIVGVGDVEGGFVDGGEKDVGEDGGGLGSDAAFGDGEVEECLNGAEAVLLFEVPPGLPAEDDGTVEEEDPLHFGGDRGVEEGDEAGAELPEGIGGPLRGLGGGEEVFFDGLEDGEEERLFVGEVVVERASGSDAGGGDDFLGAGVEIAFGDEEAPCGGHQRGSGGERLLPARGLRRRHPLSMVDVQAVCRRSASREERL
jgi:hypothetical protein